MQLMFTWDLAPPL